jgi:hypothetical protein
MASPFTSANGSFLLESAPNDDPLSVNVKIRPQKATLTRHGRSLENKGNSHISIVIFLGVVEYIPP